MVVGPDGRTAFISNYGEATLHTLARVDLVGERTLPAVDVLPLKGAHGLAVHEGLIWFTAEGSKALGVLDPATGKVLSVLGTGQEKTAPGVGLTRWAQGGGGRMRGRGR